MSAAIWRLLPGRAGSAALALLWGAAIVAAVHHANGHALEVEGAADRVLHVALVAEVQAVRVARDDHEGGRTRGSLGDVVEPRGATALGGRRVLHEHALEEAVQLAGGHALRPGG